MGSPPQEWDWPPQHRPKVEVLPPEARVHQDAYQRANGAWRPTSNRTSMFLSAAVFLFKVAVAIPLSLIVVGAIWLLSVLFRLV